MALLLLYPRQRRRRSPLEEREMKLVLVSTLVFVGSIGLGQSKFAPPPPPWAHELPSSQLNFADQFMPQNTAASAPSHSQSAGPGMYQAPNMDSMGSGQPPNQANSQGPNPDVQAPNGYYYGSTIGWGQSQNAPSGNVGFAIGQMKASLPQVAGTGVVTNATENAQPDWGKSSSLPSVVAPSTQGILLPADSSYKPYLQAAQFLCDKIKINSDIHQRPCKQKALEYMDYAKKMGFFPTTAPDDLNSVGRNYFTVGLALALCTTPDSRVENWGRARMDCFEAAKVKIYSDKNCDWNILVPYAKKMSESQVQQIKNAHAANCYQQQYEDTLAYWKTKYQEEEKQFHVNASNDDLNHRFQTEIRQ